MTNNETVFWKKRYQILTDIIKEELGVSATLWYMDSTEKRVIGNGDKTSKELADAAGLVKGEKVLYINNDYIRVVTVKEVATDWQGFTVVLTEELDGHLNLRQIYSKKQILEMLE